MTKVRALAKGTLLCALMGGAAALVIRANPPRSARQEAFNRWIAQMSDTEQQQLSVTLREDKGEGRVAEYALSGVSNTARILRLVDLAREAELFRSEPVTELTPTAEDPVTEILVVGADKRFLFRDRRSRLSRSIAARSLRTLTQLFASHGEASGHR